MADAGKLASMYWLGRINGATPDANLIDRLKAEAKSMEGVDLQAYVHRCADEMKQRGGEMQVAGQTLAAQAEPPPK